MLRLRNESDDDWLISQTPDQGTVKIYSVARISIKAPSLDNYTLAVAKVRYEIAKPYPCKIFNLLEEGSFALIGASNSEDLNKKLRSILVSKSFQDAVSVLLAQVDTSYNLHIESN